jgi:hypothetical protein
MLLMAGVSAGLFALGLSGIEQELQAIACTVTAVAIGGCRYECNCRTVCGLTHTPCEEQRLAERDDTRRRYRICDSCPGHKYLYVVQTPDCAADGYPAFRTLLDKRAGAMQVTGGAEVLVGVEPGLVDYRQSEDPTAWRCLPEPVYSVGDSVAGCQMLSCDDGEFCSSSSSSSTSTSSSTSSSSSSSEGGEGSLSCPPAGDGGGTVAFGLILGGLFALVVLGQLACILKWQLLKVCDRIPPEVLLEAQQQTRAVAAAPAAEAVTVAVQPPPPLAEVAGEEAAADDTCIEPKYKLYKDAKRVDLSVFLQERIVIAQSLED